LPRAPQEILFSNSNEMERIKHIFGKYWVNTFNQICSSTFFESKFLKVKCDIEYL
jgi:hypothetical protein